jgi:hypothetical protein
MCDEYEPPHDTSRDGEHDGDDDLETDCFFYKDVRIIRHASGIVLSACGATLARREELRAAGGQWRVVNNTTGRLFGWYFPYETAALGVNALSSD